MNKSNVHIGMSGRYRLEVKRKGIIICQNEFGEDGWSPNKLLNSGLNAIGQDNYSPFSYCHLGSGTVAPANTQTQLQTWVASASYGYAGASSVVNTGAPNYETKFTYTYVFPQGAVVGTITELGTARDSLSTDVLTSRALIVDGSGNPTSISLVSLDQLTVYYELTLKPPVVDGAGSFTLATSSGDVVYNYVSRVANAASFYASGGTFSPSSNFFSLYTARSLRPDGALGPITGMPTGTYHDISSSVSTDAYVNNSFQRTSRHTWNINYGNSPDGLKGFTVRDYWQFILDAPIMKTNTRTLTLPFTISWGRA